MKRALLYEIGLFSHRENRGQPLCSILFNPPEADKGLIPHRLRRYKAVVDTWPFSGSVGH